MGGDEEHQKYEDELQNNLNLSHPVTHIYDIGKAKTTKNVMKNLKLHSTVILKHPLYISEGQTFAIIGITAGQKKY